MKIEPKNSPERDRALEAFEAIGLHSKRTSRKNEQETRRADTLKMIFRDDNRKHDRISEAEVRVSFNQDSVVTVFTLTALGNMMCYPHQVENRTLTQDYGSFNPEEIASYVSESIKPYL